MGCGCSSFDGNDNDWIDNETKESSVLDFDGEFNTTYTNFNNNNTMENNSFLQFGGEDNEFDNFGKKTRQKVGGAVSGAVKKVGGAIGSTANKVGGGIGGALGKVGGAITQIKNRPSVTTRPAVIQAVAQAKANAKATPRPLGVGKVMGGLAPVPKPPKVMGIGSIMRPNYLAMSDSALQKIKASKVASITQLTGLSAKQRVPSLRAMLQKRIANDKADLTRIQQILTQRATKKQVNSTSSNMFRSVADKQKASIELLKAKAQATANALRNQVEQAKSDGNKQVIAEEMAKPLRRKPTSGVEYGRKTRMGMITDPEEIAKEKENRRRAKKRADIGEKLASEGLDLENNPLDITEVPVPVENILEEEIMDAKIDEIAQPIIDDLDSLPSADTTPVAEPSFFEKYKKPLMIGGAVVGGLILVKMLTK